MTEYHMRSDNMSEEIRLLIARSQNVVNFRHVGQSAPGAYDPT